MSVFNFFKKGIANCPETACEISEIYPFPLTLEEFKKADMLATYTKILTDTVERTHGLSEEYEPALWDNCVQSEATIGLVTLLATAMVNKSDLFIVYTPSTGVLREATYNEKEKIRNDYLKSGESQNGVYISFKNYRRTDMLHIYSGLEYCTLASLYKTVNVSKAVQIKINELRATTALTDAAVAVEQARSIAKALSDGKDILLDVKDDVTTAQPNIEPTEKAITFSDAKRAYILGLPISYISGLQTPGIGSTGEADMRAVERGLKQYFVSIIQPVLKAVFGDETEFKSQDFRQIESALEALKTFDLVSDENLSQQSKREILARMFDIDPDKELKAIQKEEKQREENEADEVENTRTQPNPQIQPTQEQRTTRTA